MTIKETIEALEKIGNMYSYDLNVYSRLWNDSSMIYQPDCAMVQEMDDCKMVILTNSVYEENDEESSD